MSLQIWLPLNGSLKNQGIDPIQPTFRGGMTADNISTGKVTEQSFNWPSSGNGYAVSLPGFMNTFKNYSRYTLCAWVYFTGPAENHSSVICSSGNWNNAINQLCFALYSYDNGYTKVLVPNTAGWSEGVNLTNKLLPNQWYHVAAAYNGTQTTVYINGQAVGSYAGGAITAASETSDLYIGSATYYGGFTIRGNINDFRIYDHCCSAKEIAEIAKGLVIHYPLDNNGQGGTN
jgi:hypothetical protein